MTGMFFHQPYMTQQPSLFALFSYYAIMLSFALQYYKLMVDLTCVLWLFVVLQRVCWVIWNKKALPFYSKSRYLEPSRSRPRRDPQLSRPRPSSQKWVSRRVSRPRPSLETPSQVVTVVKTCGHRTKLSSLSTMHYTCRRL